MVVGDPWYGRGDSGADAGAGGRFAVVLAVLKAFTTYFQLVNLAEDEQRIEILRYCEAQTTGVPMRETLAESVAKLHAKGVLPPPMCSASWTNSMSCPCSPPTRPKPSARRSSPSCARSATRSTPDDAWGRCRARNAS